MYYTKIMFRIITILLFTLPVATWFIYIPVRILAPALNDMHCISEIKYKPRITFCSTENCNQSFGFHAPAKAHTIGTSGIVIAPPGWNEHILRHELLHHLQAERLGIVRQWRSPKWFKEGMAYSLSEDQRTPSQKIY